MAFAAWGMAEGIIMTSNTVSGFWEVVLAGQRRVRRTPLLALTTINTAGHVHIRPGSRIGSRRAFG